MKLINSVSAVHPSQKCQLPENPTVKQAVEYMKTSMDILDWNLKRSRVKRQVGEKLFLKRYITRIDCEGLCPRTIKNNATLNQNHTPFTSTINL